jgi:hypothetical protein
MLSSTVSACVHSDQASMAHQVHMMGANVALTLAFSVVTTESLPVDEEANKMLSFLLLSAQCFAVQAVEMMRLDSLSMNDLSQEEAAAGFYIQLNEVTLDSHSGDDECTANAWFAKDQMHLAVDKLGEPDAINTICNCPEHCKFKVETLIIYMLRKMSTARAHVDLTDSEFSGCPERWGTGCNHMVVVTFKQPKTHLPPSGMHFWLSRSSQ